MVEHILCKLLGLRMGQVLPKPLGIEAYLIHAHKSDGGEMVVKCA